MLSPPQPAAFDDPHLILRAFHFLARHGLPLSYKTELQIERAFPSIAANPPTGSQLWHPLQEILLAPHAADSLRAMHSLGLINSLLPEFARIDALVVRDYSHRFTVDEHTFVAIDNLHALRQSQSKWDQRYAELLEELEQPDLLYLALLLHDVGKGAKSDDHVRASVRIAETALERLKMLCLLTYADIKAVNPEALTPWKAENIWQLYIATANYLNRSLDERLHVDG